jgi:hypothetical protein
MHHIYPRKRADGWIAIAASSIVYIATYPGSVSHPTPHVT